jgi:DNA-binding response OmpR family regulator
LIVEDDVALGSFLAKGLKLEGHDVDLVGDGETGLQHALENRPDLMVLDLSLPHKDGMQVLEEMHDRFSATSVLVLTGRIGVEDRVRCLNLGADDYLMKPFSFSELNARCRALLRRRVQFADPTLRAGGVELNRMDRTVTRDGRPLELTSKEFALLEYLMQARGRICLRNDLLRDVWQASPAPGTNVVDVYVNYLRKKLGAARLERYGNVAGPDRVIETVRGEGYVMAMSEQRSIEAAVPPAGAQTSPFDDRAWRAGRVASA